MFRRLQGMFNSVKHTVQDSWTSLKNFAKRMWQKLKDFIKKLWNKFKKFLVEKLASWLKDGKEVPAQPEDTGVVSDRPGGDTPVPVQSEKEREEMMRTLMGASHTFNEDTSTPVAGLKDKLWDLYSKTKYEPLEPETHVGNEGGTYKFKSINHFLGWSEGLAQMPRGSSHSSSNDRDYDFSLSNDLEHAFEVIRKTTFDKEGADKLSALIRKIKKESIFRDEGYELEVAEYVSGSQNYWIDAKKKTTVSKIIDDPIFISASYNARTSPEHIKNVALELLLGIYEQKVIPRKVIINFSSHNVRGGEKGGRSDVFIDVDFSDLNGIAKTLHPSTFRRLIFRVEESYEDLKGNYGHSDNGEVDKGYVSLENIKHSWEGGKENIIKTLLDIKEK